MDLIRTVTAAASVPALPVQLNQFLSFNRDKTRIFSCFTGADFTALDMNPSPPIFVAD
jgi:hypothetical protein